MPVQFNTKIQFVLKYIITLFRKSKSDGSAATVIGRKILRYMKILSHLKKKLHWISFFDGPATTLIDHKFSIYTMYVAFYMDLLWISVFNGLAATVITWEISIYAEIFIFTLNEFKGISAAKFDLHKSSLIYFEFTHLNLRGHP